MKAIAPYAPAQVLTYLALTAYGMWRASFHPVYDEAYRHWLLSTPWTASQPLPRGPVHLAAADGALLLLVGGVFWVTGAAGGAWSLLQAILPFAVDYGLAIAHANFRTGEDASVAVAAALALATLLAPLSPGALAVALLAVYSALMLGVRRSLQTFPWDELRGGNAWSA